MTKHKSGKVSVTAREKSLSSAEQLHAAVDQLFAKKIEAKVAELTKQKKIDEEIRLAPRRRITKVLCTVIYDELQSRQCNGFLPAAATIVGISAEHAKQIERQLALGHRPAKNDERNE